MCLPITFETSNEFGSGVVKSWASILDDNTREAAEKISRCEIVDGHIALMPDAHFGYGPPVGTVMRTKNAVIPYAVGVDIGCGMIATQTSLRRSDFRGEEGRLLGAIREAIPSGVGKGHAYTTEAALMFLEKFDLPPGIKNEIVMSAAMVKRHTDSSQVRVELNKKLHEQFGTLGAGNHFVEICEGDDGWVWLVLHSGSRGIGNVLATAHAKLAKESCKRARVELEDADFSYFAKGSPSFDAYIADMLWCQEYAMASREAMMLELLVVVRYALGGVSISTETINCHHNYAEEIEPGVWLTRKGAINAEVGRMGIIPGSMGAATYIVSGLGCKEALNTAPHGAGRVMSRGQARREGNIEAFKIQMKDKTWQDRDAEKLLDEAPTAYKPIRIVIEDSKELVKTRVRLTQFLSYKGL